MNLALLFDLDGTLMDTIDAIVASMNAAAGEVAIEPFREDELRPMIGTPVQRQLEVLREVSGPPADAFTDRYYAHFARHVDRGVRLFPGVRETFPFLVSRATGTASTRSRDEARHMLHVTGLERYFRAVVGGDEVPRPKPYPDLPLASARALGADPSGCVVVGDSPVDVRAGRAAGMRTVGAIYGYGHRSAIDEAGPDAVLERFTDLPRVLEILEAHAR